MNENEEVGKKKTANKDKEPDDDIVLCHIMKDVGDMENIGNISNDCVCEEKRIFAAK